MSQRPKDAAMGVMSALPSA